MIDVPKLIGALIIVFIIVAWLYFAETTRNPEKFVAFLKDGQLVGVNIYDVNENLLFAIHPDAENVETKQIKIINCKAFIMNYDAGKLVGMGPFVGDDDRVFNTVFGRQTQDHTLCTNSETIRRPTSM